MKVNIRQGVFETNSSSEHTISVVLESEWVGWRSGQNMAKRSLIHNDCNETWGNFWSEKYDWEFTDDLERAKKENNEMILAWIVSERENINNWMKNPECPEKDLPYWQDRLKDLDKYEKNPGSFPVVNRLYEGCWITWDEYIDALRNGDCYSPWDHSDEKHGVHVFGYYFHS